MLEAIEPRRVIYAAVEGPCATGSDNLFPMAPPFTLFGEVAKSWVCSWVGFDETEPPSFELTSTLFMFLGDTGISDKSF